MAGLFLSATGPLASQQTTQPGDAAQAGKSQSGRASGQIAMPCEIATLGSPFIPVDSWVYPAMLRLYSLGLVDTMYLGMRPWTRASVSRMLEQAAVHIENGDKGSGEGEGEEIYEAVMHFLNADIEGPCGAHQGMAHIESVYNVDRGISGTPLRDSYHLGSTIVNDYGRPYENGLNSYSGAGGYAGAGRFQLYARGEFQTAPSAAGYSATLAQQLEAIDGTTDYISSAIPIPSNQQSTVPEGPIGSTVTGRVMEAYLSYQYWDHVVSFGKQDNWLGPGLGGGMAYSNNAEDVYSFRIDRIEPLHIPLLSRITGPFRYDFIVGPLKGHSFPISPWVHVEKISFRPSENFEVGFQRTVIWGGVNHEPINLKSFLRSFFSLSAPQPGIKNSPSDPGARFGAFDFSYRLPFVRNWFTLYVDSEVHDDLSPADAPRRASWRPGIFLSHFPGVPKLDLRLEGISTDPPVSRSISGAFMYYEGIQRQGYTNAGQLFGDWIGREDKGGQGWLTYHLSGNEWVQVAFRSQKAEKDFIPGGTTLNDIDFEAVKRIRKDFEIKGDFTYERYLAPIFLLNRQTVTATTIQLTWYPERKTSF
jgi:hypothetical protein